MIIFRFNIKTSNGPGLTFLCYLASIIVGVTIVFSACHSNPGPEDNMTVAPRQSEGSSKIIPPSREQEKEFASDPDEEWRFLRFQSMEKLSPGSIVHVQNRYGTIRTRFGGYEDQVEVRATIQDKEDDKPALQLFTMPGEGRLNVYVSYPGGDMSSPSEWHVGEQFPDQADLVLFIPRGFSLEVYSLHDQIEIKGIQGDVYAETIKGDINVKGVKGGVSASSRRGNLLITLGNDQTTQEQKFTTLTGNIHLNIWEDASFSISLATSGEITTDFSLTIKHTKSKEPGKHAHSEIGRGGPELIIESKRGHIELSRMQKIYSR